MSDCIPKNIHLLDKLVVILGGKITKKVGFVFPVYAWGPPEIVLRFIRRLKMTKPEYLFFVGTCGDDTGRTADVYKRQNMTSGWKAIWQGSCSMNLIIWTEKCSLIICLHYANR